LAIRVATSNAVSLRFALRLVGAVLWPLRCSTSPSFVHGVALFVWGVAVIASLHLHRVHGFGIANAVAHMAIDRVALANTEGLRFWKLLGTGTTFSPKDADPTTWGLFCVWDDVSALSKFEADSSVARNWSKRADEQWRATLAPIRWHGQWAKRDPFGSSESTQSVEQLVANGVVGANPRIAALTRARIKPSQWREFWSATKPVADQLSNAPGLLFALGIGEAPVGLQATFSVWDSQDAIATFAYKGVEHREVIRRTQTSGWYSEEMFSRFVVIESTGRLTGRTEPIEQDRSR
jgi:hypothetical protein